jgi:hypothetical protein
MPGSHPLQTPCPQVTKKFELDEKIVNPLFIIQFFFVLYVPCFVILLALNWMKKNGFNCKQLPDQGFINVHCQFISNGTQSCDTIERSLDVPIHAWPPSRSVPHHLASNIS